MILDALNFLKKRNKKKKLKKQQPKKQNGKALKENFVYQISKRKYVG